MTPDFAEFARLVPLGIVVGAYGTLVGAGGGAVLVPVLLLLLPNESPATVTSISLAVVFFNAYAGTVAYARMGRIDYFAATLFALAGLPGAILGTLLVKEVPRAVFDPLFGIPLLAGGLFLIVSPMGPVAPVAMSVSPRRPDSFNTLLGAVGSSYIAFVASLLGIGGGVIHVPFLIRALRFPPHVATATSQFVLTIMALTATIAHFTQGHFAAGLDRTLYLAVGVMMGAPLGAALSERLHGPMIVRLLALALCLVGVRLVSHAVW